MKTLFLDAETQPYHYYFKHFEPEKHPYRMNTTMSSYGCISSANIYSQTWPEWWAEGKLSTIHLHPQGWDGISSLKKGAARFCEKAPTGKKTWKREVMSYKTYHACWGGWFLATRSGYRHLDGQVATGCCVLHHYQHLYKDEASSGKEITDQPEAFRHKAEDMGGSHCCVLWRWTAWKS